MSTGRSKSARRPKQNDAYGALPAGVDLRPKVGSVRADGSSLPLEGELRGVDVILELARGASFLVCVERVVEVNNPEIEPDPS